MGDREVLESRLAELERAHTRLRRRPAAGDDGDPVSPPPAAEQAAASSRPDRSPAEAAEDAAADHVHEQLMRLAPAVFDLDELPAVPADSRGLLRPVEDLDGSGAAVTVRCSSDPAATSLTLTGLLSAGRRPFALTLELVRGTARENAAYARRVAAAYPSIQVFSGPRPDPITVVPMVTLDSGVVPGEGWLDLLLADAAASGSEAALARSPEDPDAAVWLGAKFAPSWASASDLAPLAVARPAEPGMGEVPVGAGTLVKAGVQTPRSWVRSRALVARQTPAPPAPSLLDARAHGARLADALGHQLRVGFVILGVPPGGGGGTHSIYQETTGMRRTGAHATILLPADRLAHARSVYTDADDEVFTPFTDPADLARRAAQLDVIVATEFPTVRLLSDALETYPGLRAYYLQDYEPLFAPRGSRAADEALLSLGAFPDGLLFAKTRWLCSLVESVHGCRVNKVQPSLDRPLFQERPRTLSVEAGPLRVLAMVRPRTTRRRPAATVRVLERLRAELGDQVDLVSFGCPAEELQEFLGRAPTGVRHQGILSREEVAELMSASDVFLDLSIYQAFGRSGLEAMACGCVPVLPTLGGAREYAVDGVNAILLDVCDDDAVVAAVTTLAGDAEALERLRDEGLGTVQRFSIERAALSLQALFVQSLLAR
jgi:glycosyltransferase involved in cell wall biosynthesis